MALPRVPRSRPSDWLRARRRTTPPQDDPQQPTQPEPQPEKPSKAHTWLNTASTAITALIAIPALILALITYQDQKDDSEERARESASQVYWYWTLGERPRRAPTHLIVENRSLRPVYRALINLEEETGENRQVFYIDDTVSPCTRVTYTLGKHGKEVMNQLDTEMFFENSIGELWRTDYWGAPHKLDADEVTWSQGLDMIENWNLPPKYTDLDACG